MRRAVEAFPRFRVAEPEVRSAVDDQCFWTELFGQGRRMTMGQAKKDDVVAAQYRELSRLDDSLSQRHQVRMVLTEQAAGAAGRRHCPYRQTTVDVCRVPEKQAEYLAPRITAGTGDRHPYCVDHSTILHGYAAVCKFIRAHPVVTHASRSRGVPGRSLSTRHAEVPLHIPGNRCYTRRSSCSLAQLISGKR